MAKFETNVAGVTFHEVDFSRIKTSSKVELIPEPENKYDSKAIKVVIDGKQVGYIKKTMNGTILNYLVEGAPMRARVKAIVGGDNGKNQGILLSISVYEEKLERTFADDLGEWSNEILEDFTVTNGVNLIEALSKSIPTWETFLEISKHVPPKQPVPPEPDYELRYKNSTSIIHRLLSNDFDDFRKKLRHEWKIARDKANQENEKRTTLVKGYSETEYADEYQKFVLNERIQKSFKDNKITSKTSDEILEMFEKGYVSSYENLLFENLSKVYPAYQQVKYHGFLIDILLVAPKTNLLWAIEVDGNIHRTKTISKNDAKKVDLLTTYGVSVIRVSNFYVGHHLEKAVNRIIETVG